ncbi:MAG: ATP-binding protein [Ktedonobacteraceae bacterium]
MDTHGKEERDGTERHQREQHRREAEQELSSRAHQLEAIFEAMADGIFVYDKDGHILRMNRAARDLLGLDDLPGYTALSLEERGTLITQHYVQGQSLPLAQWATTRVLSGEVLTDTTAVEFTIRNLRGREMRINLSGAPIRDREGNIVGSINICRDVTDRWKLAQRTQEALHALLAMAEALVQVPQHDDELNAQAGGRESPAPAATYLIGQRLAELTRNTLGCRRVSLTALERETGRLRPVAVVGLSPEEERQWMSEIGQFRLDDYLAPALLARLQAGEVVLNDLSGMTASDPPTYGAREVLLAPMNMGAHLAGVLALDYGGEAHAYPPEEEALAGAVAKLATLMIERERILQESTEARARELASRETTQRMDEFLGVVAHELRTPLASLSGFAQTLLVQTAQGKGPQLAVWQRKALAGLDLAVARLGELTDDLLDMARLQAGQLELHPEPTDLVPLVQRVVTRLQMTTERHTIVLVPSGEHLVKYVDPRRMDQVLSNLISNAIKYSPEGGPIEVTIAEDVERRETLLSVRDHGIGVPAQQQAQIFQRFVQTENARVYGIEGTGLGLYLCRALVERHGGRIWCESIEGQGSTFFITLPVVSKAAPGR